MCHSLELVLAEGMPADAASTGGGSGAVSPLEGMSRRASAINAASAPLPSPIAALTSSAAMGRLTVEPSNRPKMQRMVTEVEHEIELALSKLRGLIEEEKARLKSQGELAQEEGGALAAGIVALPLATPGVQVQAAPENAAQANIAQANAAQDDVNPAAAVRRNLLRGGWTGYTRLTRGRKILLIFRICSSFAQVITAIAILSLPTSLGDSLSAMGGNDLCNPEPMFVWLLLHTLRVAVNLPIDIYLGLSPHRTGRARRPNAQGLLERESNRAVGSLHLDRKLGKLGDLLGFVHVVLFIVGSE